MRQIKESDIKNWLPIVGAVAAWSIIDKAIGLSHVNRYTLARNRIKSNLERLKQ